MYAGRRGEIDDQAIRVDEIGSARRRDVELDRTLVREVREMFRLAPDGIDREVLVLSSLARVLFRRRAAPRHGEALDRLRVMIRDVLLEEPGRAEPLRVAANGERTTQDVRQRGGCDPLVGTDAAALGPPDPREDGAARVRDFT